MATTIRCWSRDAHDVLSLVKLAANESDTVHLVGLGQVAGASVAAARSQAGDAIDQTFIDLGGFRFESLTRHDDPMFVPGAVKYLDVDGLLALAAPARIAVTGAGDDNVATRVYRAMNSADSLTRYSDRGALLDSLTRR